MYIVHNDEPHYRVLTSADFEGMRRKVVIAERRILNREAANGGNSSSSACKPPRVGSGTSVAKMGFKSIVSGRGGAWIRMDS